MHRATPNSTSLRAYSSGGSRGVVDTIDDSQTMQAHSGSFMKNESRTGIESPQNYGFTSHNMPADKDKDGKITGSAETFYSFMGGGRSFPVSGPIDDRRHRLKGLSAGDVAMFRTNGDDTQLHLTPDGMFHSAPEGRTVRMQLVPPGSGKASSSSSQSSSQSQPQASTQAANGGGGGGGTGQQQQGGGKQKTTGQKAVASAGKDSPYYIHVKKEETAMAGKMVKSLLDDKKTYHHVTDKKDYCGGEAGKDQFSKVLTLAGPAVNVYGRIG